MALIDSTDKLYIFAHGLVSISIVNTTPSISGVNATYTLLQMERPPQSRLLLLIQGVPLTYSIISDTSGNIATVSQGTGSNTKSGLSP